MASMSITRRVPLDDSWDVVVCGGGPAGCMAAASAAREGARTLLVEGTGCLGGMGTAGLVPAWCGFDDREKLIHRGLADRVRQGLYGTDWGRLDLRDIDFELLKRIYDGIVTSAGAHVLLQTAVTGVHMASEDTIDAVLIANKAGLSAVRARVYIDCTGDGDVAAWAGAEFEKGTAKGDMQPVTHCYIMSHIEKEWKSHWPEGDFRESAKKDPKYPLIVDSWMNTGNGIGAATHGFNAGHMWDIDGTDPESLTNGHMTGRQLVAQHQKALAEYYPGGFGEAFLATTAPLLGVRETRRIVGDYVLTVEDYNARRSFDDEIARNSFYLDLHHTQEEATSVSGTGWCNAPGAKESTYGPGESHGIPYRCLTPTGLSNVLVAGRCISTDRPVNGAIRVMPPCMSMGEAAGIASVLAGKQSTPDVHTVDIAHLRKRLGEVGAYVPEPAVEAAAAG